MLWPELDRQILLIQAKLAEMYVAVETMRTFTYRVLAAANDLEIGGGGRGHIHALGNAHCREIARLRKDLAESEAGARSSPAIDSLTSRSSRYTL